MGETGFQKKVFGEHPLSVIARTAITPPYRDEAGPLVALCGRVVTGNRPTS